MKKLVILPLVVLCLWVKAQTVKVQLKLGGYYITDTIKLTQASPDNPSDTFIISFIVAKDQYFISTYKSNIIYIDPEQIERSPTFDKFYNKLTNLYLKKDRQDFENKNRSLIDRFGKQYAYMILNKEVSKGMTKDMVGLSLGKPKSITHTIYEDNAADLWEYDDKFIYFTNGYVSGWTEISK